MPTTEFELLVAFETHSVDRRLLNASGRNVPPLDNVPNRYLNPG